MKLKKWIGYDASTDKNRLLLRVVWYISKIRIHKVEIWFVNNI